MSGGIIMSLLFAFVFFGCIWAGCDSAYAEGDYALNFRRKADVDYVKITGMSQLRQFTVCFWMKSSDPLVTIFSYTEATGTNDLRIIANNKLELDINGEKRYPQVSATDGIWHHICVKWTNVGGWWHVYKDGEAEDYGSGFQSGYTIQSGGSLVLGQDQDSLGGGFEARQSFKGYLANLNVWSYRLTRPDIEYMSHSCLRGEGNVYKWADFKHRYRGGGIEPIVPSPCPHESS